MVHNKDPMSVLYDMVKDLYPGIKIFKSYMDSDENSTPNSYILLKARPRDNTKIFGDGQSLIRGADGEINLISKGAATTSKNIHNVNCQKIENTLKNKRVSYSVVEVGYNKDLHNTQTTYAIRINYA